MPTAGNPWNSWESLNYCDRHPFAPMYAVKTKKQRIQPLELPKTDVIIDFLSYQNYICFKRSYIRRGENCLKRKMKGMFQNGVVTDDDVEIVHDHLKRTGGECQ